MSVGFTNTLQSSQEFCQQFCQQVPPESQNYQCKSTFSGNASEVGNCTQDISWDTVVPMTAPEPKEMIESFSIILGILCAQVDGVFCFPQYRNASQQLSNLADASSSAALDKFCSPCTAKVMDYMSGDMDYDFYTDMVCTRIGTKYCYPTFVALTSNMSSTLAAQEALMCGDACVPTVFMKYDQLTSSDNSAGPGGPGLRLSRREGDPPPPGGGGGPPSYGQMVEAFCSNDGSSANQGKGKTCIQAMGWSMFGASSDGPPADVAAIETACGVALDGPEPPVVPQTCEPACAAKVAALVGGWGCCLNSFTSAVGPAMGGPLLQFFTGIAELCKVGAIPGPCGVSSRAANLSVCIGMPNLR
jgi:hypothetical protein